jgi:hypothetical protein
MGVRSLRLPDGTEVARHITGSAKIEVRFSDPRAMAAVVPGTYADMKGTYLKVPLEQAFCWEQLVDRAVQEARAP